MGNDIDIIRLAVEFVSGNLSQDESRKFKKDLKNNRNTREIYRMVTRLTEFKDDQRRIDLTENLVEMASRMFQDFNRAKGKKHNQGLNVYDSGLIPHPEGIRPSVVDSRRLKYKFDDFEVELALYPISVYSNELIGLVRGLDDPKDVRVKLRSKEETIWADIDDSNMFIIKRAASIDCVLSIIKSGREIGRIEIKV